MKRTVVIVDDSQFMINNLTKFFENELSFKVVASGKTGLDALPLYKEHKPDLITLDIVMPKKSGKEALSDILEFDAEARVLMISAVRDFHMLDCIHQGAKQFIEKPLRLNEVEYCNEFKDTINNIFSGKK